MKTDKSIPLSQQLTLDHVGHFVADIQAAHSALHGLGFIPTPRVLDKHQLQDKSQCVTTGIQTHSYMLEEGYIEISHINDPKLPIAKYHKQKVQRYIGIHKLAFGTNYPEETQGRLTLNGFHPLPLDILNRDRLAKRGANSNDRATICRVREEDMPEGDTLFIKHHTALSTRHPYWIKHPNQIKKLRDVIMAVEDPNEVVGRYSWFLNNGSPKKLADNGWRIQLERGSLIICDKKGLSKILPGIESPSLPYLAGYSLLTADIRKTKRFFDNHQVSYETPSRGLLRLDLCKHVGGTLLIAEEETYFQWAEANVFNT